MENLKINKKKLKLNKKNNKKIKNNEQTDYEYSSINSTSSSDNDNDDDNNIKIKQQIIIHNANRTSIWYWSMHRCLLNSEYTRVYMKMKNLKENLNKCTKLIKNYELNKSIIINNNNEDINNTDDNICRRCYLKQYKQNINKKLIKFDLLINNYYNTLIYFNKLFTYTTCTCNQISLNYTKTQCIICYLNKYNKNNLYIIKCIHMDHSYTKFYRPIINNNMNNNTIMYENNIDKNQFNYNNQNLLINQSLLVTQTPPATPPNMIDNLNENLNQFYSNNNSNSNNNMMSIINYKNNKNFLSKNNSVFISASTSSSVNILDAGSELDPNDVHKLPNIYDELKFNNGQNNENLLNVGVINGETNHRNNYNRIHASNYYLNKKFKNKQLKRKLNGYFATKTNISTSKRSTLIDNIGLNKLTSS